ncbi:tRNA ligase 1 isoform X1 [Tanacetum coccineum]
MLQSVTVSESICYYVQLESTKGTYVKEWVAWEKQLREVLSKNAEYLKSIQVPFDLAVNQVLEQLKKIMKGEYITPISEKRKFGTIVFAAIDVHVADIRNLLSNISESDTKVKMFLENKDMENNLKKAHITLAHKRSHGVIGVANYGRFENQNIPVDVTALLFSDKLAALETNPGSVDGEKISSKNEWPHLTLWTAQGIPPKEANTLPELVLQGKATRIEFNPPFRISGVMHLTTDGTTSCLYELDWKGTENWIFVITGMEFETDIPVPGLVTSFTVLYRVLHTSMCYASSDDSLSSGERRRDYMMSSGAEDETGEGGSMSHGYAYY